MNFKNIGYWLINISSSFANELLARRLEQIGNKLLTGVSEGTLAVREQLYNKSLNTFLENPFFGTSLDYGLRMNTYLGGHSELLDNLGKLGIVGIIPFLLIFGMFIINERKQNKKNISGAYILTLLFMFLFNPFNYPQANFVLFFILPSIGWIICKEIEEKYTSKN